MNLKLIRSDAVYRELLALAPEARENHFIARLLWPFKDKFAAQNIPLKAKEPGRFDALQLLSWMHLMPAALSEADRPAIDAIASDELWASCRTALENSLNALDSHQRLPVRD